MPCNVCIGGDFADCDGGFDFSRITNPKAKKPHRCGECRRSIEKGQVYERFVGKFDGAIFSQSTCLECAEISRAFSCEVPPPYGGLWSEMCDYAFPELTTASECFQKLSPSAKAFCLQRWREWKGLAANETTQSGDVHS